MGELHSVSGPERGVGSRPWKAGQRVQGIRERLDPLDRVRIGLSRRSSERRRMFSQTRRVRNYELKLSRPASP
jgi:hypothetical protein